MKKIFSVIFIITQILILLAFSIHAETENKEIVKMINDKQPDLLWVGMTAPKQEKWVYRNRADLEVRIIGSTT